MNVKQLIAAVAVFSAAGSALADGYGAYVDFSNVVSTKTRAEVVAELKQAQADGTLAANDNEYPVVAPLAGNSRSRAEVRAEAVQSVKNQGADAKNTYFGG